MKLKAPTDTFVTGPMERPYGNPMARFRFDDVMTALELFGNTEFSIFVSIFIVERGRTLV